MNRVEKLKVLYLSEVLRLLGAWSVIDTYGTLSATQRRNIAGHAIQLKEFLETKAQPVSSEPALLEIACLVPDQRGRNPYLLANLSPSEGGLTANDLVVASSWLFQIQAIVSAYSKLATKQLNVVHKSTVGNSDPVSSLNSESPLAVCIKFLRGDLDYSLDEPGELTDIYHRLTIEEGRELGRFALALVESGDHKAIDIAKDIFLNLACLLPGSLLGLYQNLAELEVFTYSGIIYREADRLTRDHFVREMLLDDLHHTTDKSARLPQKLEALAWIGDSVVQELFRWWREHPRARLFRVHGPPEDYSLLAGWELTEQGHRRNLYHDQCYALIPAEDDRATGPVSTLMPTADLCVSCGRERLVLLDIDLTHPNLAFLELSGDRLRLEVCEHCELTTPLFFVKGDEQGTFVAIKQKEKPDSEASIVDGEVDVGFYSRAAHRLVLSAQPRGTFEALVVGRASQIGGFPLWYQDAQYPICSICVKRMVFLGQIQTDDFMGRPAEGITLAFVCSDEHRAAIVFQMS